MPPPRNERVRIDPSFALECYLYYKPTVESSSHTCDTLTFFVFKTVPVFYPSPSNGKRPILDDAPFRVFGDYQETNTWPPQTRHDVKLDWTVLSRPYETGKILYRGATGEEPIPLAAMPVVIFDIIMDKIVRYLVDEKIKTLGDKTTGQLHERFFNDIYLSPTITLDSSAFKKPSCGALRSQPILKAAIHAINPKRNLAKGVLELHHSEDADDFSAEAKKTIEELVASGFVPRGIFSDIMLLQHGCVITKRRHADVYADLQALFDKGLGDTANGTQNGSEGELNDVIGRNETEGRAANRNKRPKKQSAGSSDLYPLAPISLKDKRRLNDLLAADPCAAVQQHTFTKAMKSEFLVRALFPTASPEQVAEFTAEQVEAAKAAANSLGMVKGICTSGYECKLDGRSNMRPGQFFHDMIGNGFVCSGCATVQALILSNDNARVLLPQLAIQLMNGSMDSQKAIAVELSHTVPCLSCNRAAPYTSVQDPTGQRPIVCMFPCGSILGKLVSEFQANLAMKCVGDSVVSHTDRVFKDKSHLYKLFFRTGDNVTTVSAICVHPSCSKRIVVREALVNRTLAGDPMCTKHYQQQANFTAMPSKRQMEPGFQELLRDFKKEPDVYKKLQVINRFANEPASRKGAEEWVSRFDQTFKKFRQMWPANTMEHAAAAAAEDLMEQLAAHLTLTDE